MSSSSNTADILSLATLADAPSCAARFLEFLSRIRSAASAEATLELFRQGLRMFGADSGVFLSAIKDDASRTSIRSFLACDPRWVVEYSRVDWHIHDPWLRHALQSQTPIRGTELKPRSSEEAFMQRSAKFGFASSVAVPAPSSFGAARFGVLILGSHVPGYFTTATTTRSSRSSRAPLRWSCTSGC